MSVASARTIPAAAGCGVAGAIPLLRLMALLLLVLLLLMVVLLLFPLLLVLLFLFLLLLLLLLLLLPSMERKPAGSGLQASLLS